MFTGSSAINFEGTRQLLNPQIKANLSCGLYLTKGASFGGVSVIGSGIYFKNKFIIFEGTGCFNVYNYDGGISLWVGVSLGSYANGKFLAVGDTLTFTYTLGSGSTYTIYRLATSGLTVWGGTEVLYAGNSTIRDVCPTTDTKCYSIEVLTTPVSLVEQIALLKVHTKTAAWGTTIFYNPRFTVPHLSYMNRSTLNGININNEDILYLTCNGNTQDPTRGMMLSFGLRQIRSDGFNVLGVEDIYTSENAVYNLAQMNMTKGVSGIYDLFNFEKIDVSVIYRNRGGRFNVSGTPSFGGTWVIVNFTTLFERNMITNTIDGLHHSVMRVTGMSNWEQGILIYAGITQPELLFFTENQVYEINKGQSLMDVSDAIMNYSNQNNERVTLTLKNNG